MAGEFTTPETMEVLHEAALQPSRTQRADNPIEWVRKNLFNSWYNSLITIVLGAVTLYVGYRLLTFVFSTGQWEAVRVNTELFMIGLFPREERWRVIAQVILLGGGLGAGAGTLRESARDRARESGEPWAPTSVRTVVSSYWSIMAFVLVTMVAFVDTIGPWLILLATVGAFLVGRQLTILLGRPASGSGAGPSPPFSSWCRCRWSPARAGWRSCSPPSPSPRSYAVRSAAPWPIVRRPGSRSQSSARQRRSSWCCSGRTWWVSPSSSSACSGCSACGGAIASTVAARAPSSCSAWPCTSSTTPSGSRGSIGRSGAVCTSIWS